MRMVVTSPTAKVYGKTKPAGDEFDCPDKEAKLWESLARAMPAANVRAVSSGDFGFAGETARDGAEVGGRRRSRASGSYGRRDMRAED